MYLAEMRPKKRFRPSSQDAQIPSEMSMSAETLKLGESRETLGASRSSLGSEPADTRKALFASPSATMVPPVPTKSPGKTTWVDNLRPTKRVLSPAASVARIYVVCCAVM